MLFNAAVALLALASMSAAAETKTLRSRALTAPDSRCTAAAKCWLVNLETNKSTLLRQNTVAKYDPADSSAGFSIQCKVTDGGKMEFVKFLDAEAGGKEISSQYFSPETYTDVSEQKFWLRGDNRGTRPNESELLAECGTKTIDVSFHTWDGGDEFPCLEMTFELLVDSSECSPIPPIMTECARRGLLLSYAPDVPIGWSLESMNVDGEVRSFEVDSTTSPKILTQEERAWFREFHQNFFPDFDTMLRFVNADGVVGAWRVCDANSPIGLDLDGSGEVEHINGKFTIDITGDGDIESLNEWFAPTEGILIDITHGIEDGIITGHHMFGDMGGTFSDGFAKLKLFDDDVDGFVSGDELLGFALWTDANSNARLDDGELSTLADYGIVSLSTDHETFVSSATLEDGSSMAMEDLWFSR